jgi:ABC-type phosphate transport system substrate-binding protein
MRISIVTTLILLSICFKPTFLFAENSEDIAFIVNVENPVNEINVSEIRDFYFKRKKQWPNGESVRFIDRNTEGKLRNYFLKYVLRKSKSDVELYWIGQKLYTGDSAPLRETSESNTIQFVATFKGAIGYVSATAVLPDKVKVIKTTGLKED